MKTMFPDVTATTSLKSSDLDVDVVVVAVKPQNCVRLFKELKPLLEENKADPVILSICAGVPIRVRIGTVAWEGRGLVMISSNF